MKIFSLFSFSRKISRKVVSGEEKLIGRQVRVFRVSCDYVTCISLLLLGGTWLSHPNGMHASKKEKLAGSVINSRCSEVGGIQPAGFSAPNCHVSLRPTMFSDLNKPFPSLSTAAASQWFYINLYLQLKPWIFF